MSTPTSPLSRALDTLLSPATLTVIRRGEDYFRGGCVRALARSPGGRFMAIVSASADSTYRVFMETDGDTVLDCGCNCPYDVNPICKHLVAVSRAIQAGEAVAVGEDLETDPWDWLAQGRELAAQKVLLERALRSGDVALLRACVPLATRKNVHRFYTALEAITARASGGLEIPQLRQALSRQVYVDF